MKRSATELGRRPQTLASMLRRRAHDEGERLAYRFVGEASDDETSLTYAELDERAAAIAVHLRELSAQGERAVLLHPPGLDFVSAFFGCMYAGTTAVPVYPPDAARLQYSLDRLNRIVTDAQPLLTLSTSAIGAALSGLTDSNAALSLPRIVATDETSSALANDFKDVEVNADSAAFIQYTSGSTAAPRGVVLSHHNLMHNSHQFHEVFGHSRDSRGVSWLPPYHDMGLIGGILQPLYGGFPVTLMSPVTFLRRPIRWLEAVSSFRATSSGGPNFAYDLCVRKTTAEDRETLDLSHWAVAANGAEPVRSETMERFADAFAPAGFRRDSFLPCYGLAEATLIVTGGGRRPVEVCQPSTMSSGGGESSSLASHTTHGGFVSCGRVADDQRIAIVEPTTRTEVPDGQVGEIWLEGPSVAKSYWANPDLSREVFQNHLATEEGGQFLRTGDLGFVTDGELFVTGRTKDLIIVRGQNHYPQDIEWTVERCHPALRPGCGAAFTARVDDSESLVVAWELAANADDVDADELVRAVRAAVARDHGLHVGTVELLPKGGIKKTTSGKVQRSLCAATFASGQLGGRRYSLPAGVRDQESGILDTDGSGDSNTNPAVETFELNRERLLAAPSRDRREMLMRYLRGRVAMTCGLADAEIDSEESLLTFGADSLSVLGLAQVIEDDMGVAVSIAELMNAASLTEIAAGLEAAVGADVAAVPVRPDGDVTESALSPPQRALWFLQELSASSSEHNIAAALRLHGNLDVAKLRGALDVLVDRHPALRTTFESRDGEPVACILANATLCLREHDLTSSTGPALMERLADAASEPFNLASGPLVRVDLYPSRPNETVMLFTAHHIVMDFSSATTILRELEMLYGAHEATASILPSQPASYGDVVAAYNRDLAGDSGRRLRDYWTDELHGSVPDLNLRTRTSTASREASASAGTTRLSIDRRLTRRIKERARAEGVTLNMAVLSAFQLLLHRYTGQEDLLVGTPMSGRIRREFDNIVGYCMNPVAIRSQMKGNESVREMLGQLRLRVIGALDHQLLPIHDLPNDRRPGESPFRALFIFNQVAPAADAGELALLATGGPHEARCQFADLMAEPVEFEQRESPVDLHLTVTEIGDRLYVTFRYRSTILDDGAARRMLRHFENILAAIADDAGQPAAAVAMLDPVEREQILAHSSGTQRVHSAVTTIVADIERQATETPQALAVTGEAGQLSYGELNKRANRVAHLLAGRGFEPGAKVGLCFQRSPDMIVALVAALKAGLTYVPVDPSQPPGRIQAIFSDAEVGIALSHQQVIDTLPEGVDVLCVDNDPAIPSQRDDDPDLPISGTSPVYVMYTSGSTGAPKGVIVTHRSLANYVRFAVDDFGLSVGDRFLQFASISFDASAQQIYASLVSGATLVLRTDRMLSTPEAFLSQCGHWSVTVLDLPTSYWNELVVGVSKAGASVPASLRLVVLGGERALPHMVQAWQEHVGHRVRLINEYGPTEATITAISRDLTDYVCTGEVPIGRPIPGCSAYVLDEARQPVSAEVIGELYLGGAGLADGYLKRPGLTAQSFVPHPFDPGSRLYRTGDLASFTPSGELICHGRRDRQVKVSGHRIEPGEIESVLHHIPGVDDALVIQSESTGQLVAYIVARAPDSLPTDGFRASLRSKLPHYMVPSAFVVVRSLPLNRNGKVDVAALPEPERTASGESTEPRTPTERFLVETFSEVLGVTGIGVNDDFFDLGGQSLLATKVIGRIQDHFKLDVPLHEIFHAPTVSDLAALLDRMPLALPMPPLEPVPRDQPLPLTFAQEGIWFLQRLAPESSTYNVPRSLRIRGHFDLVNVREALAVLERRHEILRTTFPDIDGEPVQIVHPPRGIPVSMIEMAPMEEEQLESAIRQKILEAGRRPFDLTTGPLIRTMVIRLGPADHVLIVIEHHLIHDGWSQGVFLRDFLETYDALVSDRAPSLPELTVQFADYAHWQRRLLSDETMQGLIDFWKRELDGAPRILALPTDRPRPPAVTYAGDLEVRVIEQQQGRDVRHLSNEQGVTLFMTAFAAFSLLLYDFTEQDDFVVGVGVANRQRPEAEDLIGMIINTILMRAQISADASFADFLQEVRGRAVRAYAHQDMPFGRLVRAIQPERSLNHMPLCQVMFTFLDTPMPRIEGSGLTFEVMPAHNKTAKFDLNVVVQPHTGGLGAEHDHEADHRLSVYMEYNADVFDATTIRRLLDRFEAILDAAIDAPEQSIMSLLQALNRPLGDT